ncbi:MAG: hypothetical protein R2706_04920 [Acidimicrobiales bacterium]
MIEPFAEVFGQEAAIARLSAAAKAPVHAYLLLGPRGSGTELAARSFASLLLSEAKVGEAADRDRRLALAGSHPDYKFFEPQGSAYRVEEAEAIISAAATSPVEGNRKVLVVGSVEMLVEATIGKLLKVIEEPPPTVVVVLLAEEIRPELVTIASRCVTVEFAPVSSQRIAALLESTGVDPARAAAAADASGGDVSRAHLLATDDALAVRAALWHELPTRLNGTGSTVVELVNQIRDAITTAQAPLEARQAIELEELAERAERLGERGSGRADLVASHKREVRRLRTDELRFGLATLARHYRDAMISAADPSLTAKLEALREATEALVRNPNEPLLLQSLLLRLDSTR